MEESISLAFLIELAKKFPNDQILGHELRKLLLEKQKEKNGKTGN